MTYKVLLLPGDGIGPEIVNQAKKVIDCLNTDFGVAIECEMAQIGGSAIDATGSPLPNDTIKLAKSSDAILLGAVGGEKWENLPLDQRPEKGLLQLRQEFDFFANLRPAFLFDELVNSSSLKPELVSGLDLMIIRELTGGIYFGEPRGIKNKTPQRDGFNTLRYNEQEISRIAKIGFEVAASRNNKLCSVDKANVLEVSQLWREVLEKEAQAYLAVDLSHMYVDNCAMQLVANPKQFDVIVTDNMFGDILSDCAAMLTGSIGMLPSASLNKDKFGLFEPVHGSAPQIAGKDIANPIATILSLAMFFQYSIQRNDVADKIRAAVKSVLSRGIRTMDIASGSDKVIGTDSMGDNIVKALRGS